MEQKQVYTQLPRITQLSTFCTSWRKFRSSMLLILQGIFVATMCILHHILRTLNCMYALLNIRKQPTTELVDSDAFVMQYGASMPGTLSQAYWPMYVLNMTSEFGERHHSLHFVFLISFYHLAVVVTLTLAQLYISTRKRC